MAPGSGLRNVDAQDRSFVRSHAAIQFLPAREARAGDEIRIKGERSLFKVARAVENGVIVVDSPTERLVPFADVSAVMRTVIG
jgi:hypothetical protein